MERERQYRVVTQALAAFAGLLAVGAMVTAAVSGGAAAGFLLALGTLVVTGAIYASSNAETHHDVAAESPEERLRRRRLEVAVTAVLGGLLVALLLIEVLAVLAGLGFFLFLGTTPLLVIEYYAVPVGVLLAAFAGAAALRTYVPGEEAPTPRQRLLAYGAMGLAGIVTIFALAMNGGVAQALGLVDAPANRAPFVLALAFFPLFTALRVFGRYPRPRAAAASLGEHLRAGERDLGPIVVVGSAAAALGAVLLGAFLHYGYGDTAASLTLAGLGTVALLVLPTGVGFTRVVTEIEETREDYEAERRRRRTALLGFTGVHTALAAGVVGLAVLAPVLNLTPLVVAHFPVVLVGVTVAAAAGALARTQIQAEDEYTDWRKAVGSQLMAAVVVLAFLGVFLALELARGPIVGVEYAALAIIASWGLALVYVKNRLLLPSVVAQAVTWYQQREQERRADMAADEVVERSMWMAYLAGLVLTVLGTAVIAMMFVDVIPEPPGKGLQIGIATVWILALLAAFGVGGYRQLQRKNIETVQTQDDEDKVVGERRLRRSEIVRYSVLGFSFTMALVLFAVGGLVQAGVITQVGAWEIAPKYSTDFFVFGLLLGLGPYGYFHAREQKRIRAMDERLPEFLRDLAESKRAGMTLTEAIITASRGTYGELTPEIRKMAAQLEWGVSFTDALTRFSERVDTPLVERTVNLIVEASNAGGNVVDVLTAAADDAREIQQILQERRDSMVVYVMIIYVAFLVFLGVIGVLNAQFIPEISKAVGEASKQGAPSIGGLQFTEVDVQAFRTLFFHAAVIQGLGGGLVAGVMSGGKPVEGLKHSFIMIAIAYLAFRLLMGG